MERAPRRILRPGVVVAAILLAAGLTPVTATGHGETWRPRLAPDADAPPVLVVPGGVQGGAWGAMRDGIVRAATDLGLTVEIPEVATTSPERTRDEQINLLESAGARGFGAALVVPEDTAALRPYAEEAVAAEIPFILVGRPIEGVGSAVVDDVEASAEWLARAIIARGGDRPVVATIRGPESDGAVADALERYLADLAPQARLLPASEPAETGEIRAILEELTFSYPGLQVLFVEGGESLIAAVQHARFTPDLLVVGSGTGSGAIDLWESGAVDLLVVPDLWEIGYRSLETLERLRRGESVPVITPVPAIRLARDAVVPPRVLQSLRRVDR